MSYIFNGINQIINKIDYLKRCEKNKNVGQIEKNFYIRIFRV